MVKKRAIEYNKLTTLRRSRFGSFKQAEENLRLLGKIYFVGLSQDETDTLTAAKTPYDFLEAVFKINEVAYSRGYTHNEIDFDIGRSTHVMSRRRSIVDLFLYAMTYKPEFTLKEIYDGMSQLLNEDHNTKTVLCSTVNRRTYLKCSFDKSKYLAPSTSNIFCTNENKNLGEDELNITCFRKIKDDGVTFEYIFRSDNETV